MQTSNHEKAQFHPTKHQHFDVCWETRGKRHDILQIVASKAMCEANSASRRMNPDKEASYHGGFVPYLCCSSLTTFQALNWWSSGPFHLQIGVGKLSCLIKSLVVEQDSFSRKGFNCLRKGVPDIALMSKPFHLSLYVFRSISLAVRSTANLRIL